MDGNNKSSKGKVALGLSGGVDSSVAAYLLKEQGYEVVGVFMQCWEAKLDGCGANEDKMYAVQSAAKLGIKFESLDFIREYNKKVISYFYDEYRQGRTPNPDVMCNKEIKFGLFFDWAMKNGFDYVATGHYARVEKTDKGFSLLKGVDPTKDQSYFLYLLDQKHLSKTFFPVGGLPKKEVRTIAKRIELPTYNRPDSTGICFVGEVNIKEFLQQQISPQQGNVLNIKGEIIGTHEGVWFYTIGQRHGFTITTYSKVPLYVVSKNIETNELIVGEEKDVYKKDFSISDIHWINEPYNGVVECDVRIRHLGKIHKATVTLNDKSDKATISLNESIFGVAPGQSVVLYIGDVVLGGGIID